MMDIFSTKQASKYCIKQSLSDAFVTKYWIEYLKAISFCVEREFQDSKTVFFWEEYSAAPLEEELRQQLEDDGITITQGANNSFFFEWERHFSL